MLFKQLAVTSEPCCAFLLMLQTLAQQSAKVLPSLNPRQLVLLVQGFTGVGYYPGAWVCRLLIADIWPVAEYCHTGQVASLISLCHKSMCLPPCHALQVQCGSSSIARLALQRESSSGQS